MYSDSLFRVSFKCVILNHDDAMLVVKEQDRSNWDIPGGGIEYGETIEQSIARELLEEVAFQGTFTYQILKIHDPVQLRTRDVKQIKVVLLLQVDIPIFGIGAEATAVQFIDPAVLQHSDEESERRLVEYQELAKHAV